MPKKKTLPVHLKPIAKARGDKARRHGYQLGYWLLPMQAEGKTLQQMADWLNEVGAPVTSEWHGDGHTPSPTKKWTRQQVSRVLLYAKEARRRLYWWSRKPGNRLKTFRPYGEGEGLFTRPELVPDCRGNRKLPAWLDAERARNGHVRGKKAPILNPTGLDDAPAGHVPVEIQDTPKAPPSARALALLAAADAMNEEEEQPTGPSPWLQKMAAAGWVKLKDKSEPEDEDETD